MSLLQQAMLGVAQRAQQPTLLEQMKARRQQEEEARMQKTMQESQLQTAEMQRQQMSMQMEGMQDEMRQRQMAAQRQQQMMELLNQYTDANGNPDYRRASRAAFAVGNVDLAKEIKGLANTQQQMDLRDAQMAGTGQEGEAKPMSPMGKEQFDVERGFVSQERVTTAQEQERAITDARTTEARVKQQDSAVFDLAQLFDFDQEDPPQNLIEVRERYIDLVNSVGTATAQEQIKQEYQSKGWRGIGSPGLGSNRLERVAAPPTRITTKAQVEALPSGTKFYWQNETAPRTKQ